MKKCYMLILPLFLCLILSACCLSHSWEPATCTAPKTCTKCGETEGEALGHTFADATCTAPKTCTVCGETKGKALGHKTEWEVTNVDWISLKKQLDGKCTVCGTVEKDSEEIDSLIADGVFLFDGKEFTDRLQYIFDQRFKQMDLHFRCKYEDGYWSTHIYYLDGLIGQIYFASESSSLSERFSIFEGEDTHGIKRIILELPYYDEESLTIMLAVYQMLEESMCVTVDPAIVDTDYDGIWKNDYSDISLRGLLYHNEKLYYDNEEFKDYHTLNFFIEVA